MTKRKQFTIIFLTVFVHLIGFGIVIPVLPLYAQQFGASAVSVGWLLAVYSIFQCICAPLLGRLSDKVGRKPVLIFCMFGTAAAFLLMGMSTALWVLFLGRILDGATGGNISTAQAYIADITEPHERSKGMGLIGAAFGMGFIFGPAIGGVLGQISAATPLYFAAGLALVNAIVLIFVLPESLPKTQRQTESEQPSLKEAFHLAGKRLQMAIMGAYFLETIAFSLLTATYPLFTQALFGYGVAENGYAFAGFGVLAAIVQGGLMGRLVKAFSEKRLVFFGLGCSILAFILLPLVTSQSALWLVTAGFALGHGLVVAPLNGLASRNAPQKVQGRILGFMQSTASLGRIFGPILGGFLLQQDIIHQSIAMGRTPYWAASVLLIGATIAFIFA